jgi:S-adenosyl-L-methionine hydrolase (adenosine-forming)
LLSDFGLADPYVAQMKAIIRSVSSSTEIIDISHGIEKHDIASGSFLLETTTHLFPTGSIHVAVVDPGVGGTRLPILIACNKGVLIGPDNGLLVRASKILGFQAAYHIRRTRFHRDQVSSTFHGRDIFAFTAGMIAEGEKPSSVGPELKALVSLKIPDPGISKDVISCRVLYVDSFGNIVTNISEGVMGKIGLREGARVIIGPGKEDVRHQGSLSRSYFDIPRDQFGLLIGSQGYLEIALRESSAASLLGVKPLDRLEIQF